MPDDSTEWTSLKLRSERSQAFYDVETMIICLDQRDGDQFAPENRESFITQLHEYYHLKTHLNTSSGIFTTALLDLRNRIVLDALASSRRNAMQGRSHDHQLKRPFFKSFSMNEVPSFEDNWDYGGVNVCRAWYDLFLASRYFWNLSRVPLLTSVRSLGLRDWYPGQVLARAMINLYRYQNNGLSRCVVTRREDYEALANSLGYDFPIPTLDGNAIDTCDLFEAFALAREMVDVTKHLGTSALAERFTRVSSTSYFRPIEFIMRSLHIDPRLFTGFLSLILVILEFALDPPLPPLQDIIGRGATAETIYPPARLVAAIQRARPLLVEFAGKVGDDERSVLRHFSDDLRKNVGRIGDEKSSISVNPYLRAEFDRCFDERRPLQDRASWFELVLCARNYEQSSLQDDGVKSLAEAVLFGPWLNKFSRGTGMFTYIDYQGRTAILQQKDKANLHIPEYCFVRAAIEYSVAELMLREGPLNTLPIPRNHPARNADWFWRTKSGVAAFYEQLGISA
jgi:hypothetical protein